MILVLCNIQQFLDELVGTSLGGGVVIYSATATE